MKNSPFPAEQKDDMVIRRQALGQTERFQSLTPCLPEGDLPQVRNFPVTLEKEDNKTASLL